MDLFSSASLTALMGVIVVNLVLSGDNAVVIGMAAHRLHGQQRTLAILFGGIAAVILRIAFTIAASILMGIPALTLIGGVLLVWIAYKLLMEEVGGEEGHKEANSIWQALWIITVADVVMSLDNILAIAALARESMAVLAIGLAMSMAIVLFAGGVVAVLMERFPWINYIGSIAIAYVAGEMIMKDKMVAQVVPAVAHALEGMQMSLEIAIFPVIVAIAVPVFATWRNKRGKAEATESVAGKQPVAVSEH